MWCYRKNNRPTKRKALCMYDNMNCQSKDTEQEIDCNSCFQLSLNACVTPELMVQKHNGIAFSLNCFTKTARFGYYHPPNNLHQVQ